MNKKFAAIGALSAAAAAAAALLLKKGDKAAAPVKAEKTPQKKAYTVKDPKTASYSFVSGYKDAAAMELGFTYDGETSSFSVVEEGFMTYSSDSHVALFYGTEFSFQAEYASYYSGEGFAELKAAAEEKYKKVETVSVNGLESLKYLDGDSICYCISSPEDAYSYVLLTLFKAKDSKLTLEEIPDTAEFRAILDSVTLKKA